MLTGRHKDTAEKHSILDLVETLQTNLLALDGVDDVEFDLDGFCDNIPYVIFLPEYNIPYEDYFKHRRELLHKILNIASELGLNRTDDRIEDYGQHFYIVTRLQNDRGRQHEAQKA